MDIGQNTSSLQRSAAPWTFSTAVNIDPKDINDKDIVSCAIYHYFTDQLTRRLFETEKMLRDSLRGGLSVELEQLRLEHFDLEGRFDRAVCKLTLTNRGETRFLLEAAFYLNHSTVTTATREGILYFEELN